MPNVNKPSGLTPVKYLGGADWDGKVNIYHIAAADTNAFYPGDLVDHAATADASRGILGITLATAGNPAVGVIVAVGTTPEGGPYINPDNLGRVFRPSGAQSGSYYAAVVDDPNVIFEAQEDGVGGTIAVANAQRNCNIIYAAPGTGVVVSGTMIDSSTQAVTATLNVKLLGLARHIEDGSWNTFGANAKWLCLINNHRYRAGTTAL